MEGLDSSREERDGGVPRGPGGPPHQINAGPRVREDYVALPSRSRLGKCPRFNVTFPSSARRQAVSSNIASPTKACPTRCKAANKTNESPRLSPRAVEPASMSYGVTDRAHGACKLPPRD